MDGLFYSLVLLLYLAVFVAVLGALGVLCVVAWKKGWRVVKYGSFLLSCGLLAAGFAFCSAPSAMDSGFPFLTESPNQASLVGSYVLSPAALKRLADERQGDPGSKLRLNADHTFTATNLLPNWLWLTERGTEPLSGTGTWEIQKRSGGDSWMVFCRFEETDANGVKKAGERSLGLWIAASTKARPQYALGIGLENGDAGYLLLLRDNTAPE